MLSWVIRELYLNSPPPPLKKIDGTINHDWKVRKAYVDDCFVTEVVVQEAIDHEERVIDEMLGLRSPPQYPLKEDEDRRFIEGGNYSRQVSLLDKRWEDLTSNNFN